VIRIPFNSEICAYSNVIREAYLNGDIIVLHDFIPDKTSAEVIADSSLPQHAATNQLVKPKADKITKACWPNDLTRSKSLLQAMRSVEIFVANLFVQVFADPRNEVGTKFSMKNSTTWRFTTTSSIPYHLDVYTGTMLRAFWNLSETPRLWRIGHRADQLAQMDLVGYKKFVRSYDKNPSGSFQRSSNRYLNSLAEKIPSDQKLTLGFPRYSLWILDSLKVAHEVISGDRMAGFEYIPADKHSFYVPTDLDKLDYASWMRKSLRF